MKKLSLEPLIKRARDFERNYEWLQAAEYYNKCLQLLLKQKFSLKNADIEEKIGYCYFRRAFQANSHSEFLEYMKKSFEIYKKESRILKINERAQQRFIHITALTAYVQSFFEIDVIKIKKLLSKWWKLEKQAIEMYEKNGDLQSIGKIINDINEYSSDCYFWLVSNSSEQVRLWKESINFAEKAIEIFLKLENKYELIRAYWTACWFHNFADMFCRDEDENIELLNRSQKYAKIAIKLSEELGNAFLISKAYGAAWATTQMLEVDPFKAYKLGKKWIEFSNITKDKRVIGFSNGLTSYTLNYLTGFLIDPDKQKINYKKAADMAKKAIESFQIIDQYAGYYVSYPFYGQAVAGLASIETNMEKRQTLFEQAKKICLEGMEKIKDWKRLVGIFFEYLSLNSLLLLKTKIDPKERSVILNEAEQFSKESIQWQERFTPFSFQYISAAYYRLALVQIGLSELEEKQSDQRKILNQAIVSIKKSINLAFKKEKMYSKTVWGKGYFFGKYFNTLGVTLQKLSLLSKEESICLEAIKAFNNALDHFSKKEMIVYVAESYWHIGQLQDQIGKHREASKNYESASQAYDQAAKNIPQLKDFYKDFSSYMQAWCQIELARYAHSTEDYDKAKEHYEKAAELHKSTKSWNYLSPNYFAWTSMEDAESLSRKEHTEQAKQKFQTALDHFTKAERPIKQKIREIASAEEKEMIQRLLQASELRRKFCQARIQMEEAKLLYRQGKYLQSSKSYKEAGKEIESILIKVQVEAERNELELMIVLCRAWEKMAFAEGKSSAETFLVAAKLFEEAKNLSLTEKTSQWALANSSFCKGLAAKTQFQSTFEKSFHSMATKHVKQAADYYKRAGFVTASEYAKATQRLFDAYLYMSSAEEEVDPEKKTKYYQLTEQLLEIAAGLFIKAKQPEKTALVQNILAAAREEKALAVSLNEVMHTPTITSSTMSFTAPSPTNEASIGLEQFQHANVQANLIARVKEVKVGESFCLSVEFVNAGKEPALLTRVEDFVHPDFIVVKKPEIYRLEETCLNMKGKQLAPLKLVEAKLVLQPAKKGVYQLKPIVHYLDELGQNKSLQLKTVNIKVEEVILANRVSTGTKELDSLLLGGIPEEYAVVLTGPPSDERGALIQNFLEAGTKNDEVVFYITTEADGLENLLEKSGFYLFLCNPKPKTPVPNLSTVTWLKSKTDLNNLNMALVRASRNLQQKQGTKRIVIGNVSDVLLKDGPEVTRRWLSELISDLVSKGFTLLAVVNPEMHPSDQTGALLDLFNGVVSLTQTEDPLDCRKSLRIKKLRNQDYIKNPICLTT